VLFNPLAYIDRLTRGGFSPEQARASAEALETAFSESVATKADVDGSKRELSANIASVKHELTASIEGVKRELTASIEGVRHELSANIEGVRHELSANIEGVRHELSANIEGVKHELDLVKRDVADLKRELSESESRIKLELRGDISESESRVRLEIAQSKNETLRWMFGFVIVLIGAIFTMLKFVR
jgi:hypothetical protein